MKSFLPRSTFLTLLALVTVLSFCSMTSAQLVQTTKDTAPTGKGTGDHTKTVDRFSNGKRGHKPPPSNGIFYHGGPLILGGTNIYYIWYGAWAGNTAQTILTDFGNNLGPSPYFNINTTYTDANGTHVTNLVTLKKQADDSYSQGTSLDDNGVFAVVENAINSGALPSDTNGVYFVLTSADVDETTGFCTVYCGWHTHGTINGADIKFSFVGNPDRCPSACEAQTASSPNNNPGADGMANIIAHENEEATTDPDLNAWFDNSGAENADKCAWTFGAESTAANGSSYNMTLGNRQYLIQQNWVNANGGYCAKQYP